MNLKKLSLLASVGSLIWVGAVKAQDLTLYNDATYQSLDEAISTYDNDGGVTVDSDVTSLPFSTVTTDPDSTVSNIITPNYSTSSLSLSFNQSTPDNTSSSSGEGTVFFTVADAATYSLAGTMTISGGRHLGGELSVLLYDETTSTYLYSYDFVDGIAGAEAPLIFTADDSQAGSLTGTLTAGDLYEFDAFDALDATGPQSVSGETLTGASSLMVQDVQSVPEPSTWAFLFAGTGMLLMRSKYFARKANPLA